MCMGHMGLIFLAPLFPLSHAHTSPVPLHPAQQKTDPLREALTANELAA